MATEALLAHIAAMKYAYQAPLYRLEQMFAAQGFALDRATLAFWMGRTAWWLRPLHALLLDTVLSYPKLFADETPVPVLDPGRGKTKPCQFWAVATDDRPWGGPAPPAVAYVFAEDRKGKRATELFEGFTGILQVDGYAGYNGLVAPERKGARLRLPSASPMPDENCTTFTSRPARQSRPRRCAHRRVLRDRGPHSRSLGG